MKSCPCPFLRTETLDGGAISGIEKEDDSQVIDET